MQILCLGSSERKDPFRGLFSFGVAVAEDVRTVFERLDDVSIYIPALSPTL